MNTSIQNFFKLQTQRWRQRSVSERRVLIALAVLIAFAVFWFWIWQPINRHLDEINTRLPRAQAELDIARAQWREAAGLARQTSPKTPSDTRIAFMRVAERLSVASIVANLEAQGNQITCTFSSLPFSTLVSLLDALQREESFYVIDATLIPLSQGGSVRAELLLTRPNAS
ncbi:MAG: type II secretion system protein M [Burkholderiales bacterium]|jgi:general secretion pathway protein M|nr:type II secretion system protein M [Burkholderiales bacterium]